MLQGRPLISAGPFKGLAHKGYKAILIDPPWKYLTWSKKGMSKSPDNHYSTMTIPDLMALPISDLAHKDCVMFMWVIDSHTELAFNLLKSWGFKFKTIGFYWAKTNKDGSWFMNTGHWTRANPEHVFEAYLGESEQEVERCFLNTVGKPKRKPDGKAVRRLVVAQRRGHSEKPDEVHTRIEKLVEGPYLELFARRFHPGWSVWGDEIDPVDAPDIQGLI